MIHNGIQFLGLGGEMSVGYVSCLVSGSPGQIAGARDNIEKSDPPSPHMSPLPGPCRSRSWCQHSQPEQADWGAEASEPVCSS